MKGEAVDGSTVVLAFFVKSNTKIFFELFEARLEMLDALDQGNRQCAGIAVDRAAQQIFGPGGAGGNQVGAEYRAALAGIEEGGLAGEEVQSLFFLFGYGADIQFIQEIGFTVSADVFSGKQRVIEVNKIFKDVRVGGVKGGRPASGGGEGQVIGVLIKSKRKQDGAGVNRLYEFSDSFR